MGKKRTLSQYRTIDLILFALMLTVFETIIIKASTRWFPAQPYTVSLAAAVTAIVMTRWGAWAGIHAALGGLVLCAASGAAPAQYAVYCGGNLFALLAIPVIRLLGGNEEVRNSSGKTVCFGAAVLLAMQLGRALISLLTGAELTAALGFFTTEVITDLFTLVILWIARRADGLLEDQEHYLERIAREERG